jgi:asparagine synthase (glutamine-hydrolysing)
MCGIAGLLAPADQHEQELRATVERMSETLAHRGPDDAGVWIDAACGVGLGHRRLSVLDLSVHGHQPMLSSCGRLCLVYNGEIYNHAALRRELESCGHRFRGHCDTEVLVAALSHWGVDEAVGRLVGMFAFAAWDREKRVLTLARDPLGIKPLYYGWQNGCFLFGSELRALRAHPGFSAEIDRNALALFLRHNYVPGPYSIYRGIDKLPPGSLLCVSPQTAPQAASPRAWWDLRQVAEEGARNPFRGSPDEAIEALDQRLREAVRLEMEADVPLGVFLSGGIDSSTIAATMQAQSPRRVRTFTIGFDEAPYDEAVYAKAVAGHLGTEHTEHHVTAAEAREQIPALPRIYDEPFADSSQVPTALLAKLTRRDVTVCLSGDGGDELFCGYDRYDYLGRLWRRIGWCPAAARRIGSRILRAAAAGSPSGRLAGKLHTLSDLLSPATAGEFYARFNTHWRNPADVVLGGRPAETVLSWPGRWTDGRCLLEQMMLLDTVSYLPDDLLVKVDRASMAVGLEARVPLLDHRVVAFVWTLPLSLKTRGGQTKWLLRRVLERYIPPRLFERPKMGFGIPLAGWLRGPLRQWAEDLLDERRLRRQGFFRPEPIRQKWTEHLSGRRDWQYLMWDVLMFQTWLDAHGS